MCNLLILVHEGERFTNHYVLHEIANELKSRGNSVTIQCGIGPHLTADAAMLHVDRTIVPEEYMAWISHYSVVINGRTANISKRHISSNLVRAGDGYYGPVLVKTNANACGVRETQAARAEQVRQGRRRADVERGHARSFLQRSAQFRQEPTYRILESAYAVPYTVWNNPELVVERFLPERENDLYCLRTWQFFGTAELNSISYAKEPIVKARNVIRTEVAEVPEELRAIRARLGFDFGKFDYAIVAGSVVLYDANRTPTLGKSPNERYLQMVRGLAKGLAGYVGMSA